MAPTFSGRLLFCLQFSASLLCALTVQQPWTRPNTLWETHENEDVKQRGLFEVKTNSRPFTWQHLV